MNLFIITPLPVILATGVYVLVCNARDRRFRKQLLRMSREWEAERNI